MSEHDDRPLSPEETPASVEEADDTPVVASPGAQLTAERRNQGLSLGDIARQLKISVRQVEALERDDYSGFSGSVFVRGFLRNYAKLLHLDPEQLVAGAHSAALTDIESPAAEQVFASGTSSERPRNFLVGGIIGVLVVLTILLLASNAPRNRNESGAWNDVPALQGPPADSTIMQRAAPPPASQMEPAPAYPASDAKPAAPSPAPTASNPEPSAAPENASPSPSTTPADSEPVPKLVVSGSGPIQIKLEFDGESWVEVRDGTGETLLSRLNAPGSTRILRGTPPFSLVVGNAHSVKVSYRDKSIDLLPHTRVDVARITLE